MPMLKNRRAEKMAQYMARGMSQTAASKEAGFKSTSAGTLVSARSDFQDRVLELKHKAEVASVTARLDSPAKIHADMDFLWDWCVRVNEVAEPCPACETKFEKLCDMKHAVRLIEFRGLEQGMFKRQLDVTSRKAAMIEGTQDQIIDRLRQLLERLGVAAMAQLLRGIAEENLLTALGMIGFIARKHDGQGLLIQDGSQGDAGNGRDSGVTDVEPLPALSETGDVS